MAHEKQKYWPGVGSSMQSRQIGIPQLAQNCSASILGWFLHLIQTPLYKYYPLIINMNYQ